ncbi:MAG: hypothetical protein JNN30_07075 [Rhodanobacteraceae bacterium]|nr:hypothetical protein [Rhodanobacteraceae bacterium]
MNVDEAGEPGDKPLWLPDAVRRFIALAVVTGDMALPFHYPRLGQLDAWQSGFRRHGLTGESLVSAAPGAWQPGWYVIALNGFDDPFFIDAGEQGLGFPVYYAPHGAGRWDAQRVAQDIDRFAQMLTVLRDLADDAAVLRYIETEAGLSQALWREVHEGRRDRFAVAQEFAQQDALPDPQGWRYGVLVLVDPGPQRLKVVQLLRKLQNLTPQQALVLVAGRDVSVAEGYFTHLRSTQQHLTGLGATVEFRCGESGGESLGHR